MNPTDLISQLTHIVVRLECEDLAGRRSYGSGYFFCFCSDGTTEIPCIVTNKHVVKNAVKGSFTLTFKKNDGTPDIGNHEVIEVFSLQRLVINHPKDEVDLVAIPIAPILLNGTRPGKQYFHLALRKENIASAGLLASLSPMEEVVMLGYPNGLWDSKHNMPIVRRGITATHARLPWNGRPEFLIDAACFPGSSGSPVFLANRGSYASSNGGVTLGTRFALLGTLWGGPELTRTGEVVTVEVPTDTKSFSVGTIPMNLGFVIQAEELIHLEEEVRRRADSQPVSPPPPRQVSRNSPCPCSSGKRYKECCGLL